MATVVRRVDNITKSSKDNREYRGIELSNGLRVLLVSDKTTDKSAASMDVAAGHLMDPWEMPGTAHFCEHMLFMGTEKYPGENDFSKFMSDHAGMSNAFTSSDHTCYYMDIKPEMFREAVDRFIQFFIKPMFIQDAVEREVLAVDSEHSKNLKSDIWRFQQVERSLSKLGHDFGKFGTGDKHTLGDLAVKQGLDPRETLLKFHKEWYSSNTMTCVLLGKESLDELESYVSTMEFDKIPNKASQLAFWNEQPYGPEQLKRKISIVPIKEIRRLKMHFPIPYLHNEYRSYPAHYLTHLIGHEGKGSLLSELKRQGLATGLASTNIAQARGIEMLGIITTLTEEGVRRVDDVIEMTFQYLGLLGRSGTQRWIFDELSQTGAVDFEYHNKIRPSTFVRSYANRLHEVPFEDALTYAELMTEYKPDLIDSVLNCLTPDNFFYVLIDKSVAGQEGNTTEPIYGTEIRNEAITQEQINRFRKALDSPNPVFHLPEPNLYIPREFALKEEKAKSEQPAVIENTKWCRLWHKKDEEYLLPKAITSLRIHSPAIRRCPKDAVLLDLFKLLLKDSLTESVYNAQLAGLSHSFEAGLSHFAVEVSGYDEKQALFLAFLLKHLVEFIPEQHSFDIQLKELQRAYRNTEHDQPTALSAKCRRRFLWDLVWTNEQRLAESASLTLNDVLQFRRDMLSAFHIEIFSHGNVTEQETRDVACRSTDILTAGRKARPLYANEFWLNRELELPEGQELVYNYHKNSHDVTCVQVWFQVGLTTTKTHALNYLFSHMLHEPAFNTLRTQETLGYTVWNSTQGSHGSSALHVLVQGTHDPAFVRSRIFAFLDSFRESLATMTDNEFEVLRTAAITELLVKPKTMDGRNARFWEQITTKVYDFNKFENYAEFLRSVTKKDILDFYDRKIAKGATDRRILTVCVHSRKDNQNGTNGTSEEVVDYTVVDCPYKIRNTLGLYPRAKPCLSLPPLGVSPFTDNRPVEKAHI